MKTTVEILVKLRVPDVVAVTAKDTLSRRMGFKNILKNLEKEDYWALTLNVHTTEEARKAAVYLCERTSFFVNPSKQTYRFLKAGSRKPEAGSFSLPSAYILVQNKEDSEGEIMLRSLRNLNALGQKILVVRSGCLWKITFFSRKHMTQKTIKNIVETRALTTGLLMNPHYQDYVSLR